MKKIINKAENVVPEMCRGITMASPQLTLDADYKIIHRKKIDRDKVNLISGGGSGHEPAHAGFVGKGMLDAAVCGDVFASPSQIQIYKAITRAKSTKGVLLIIKNYSGDIMNFKNAAYLASEDGIHVDYVIVDDDIAVQDSLYTVGRRGVAGTVFVHKIAGAAAEQGMDLAEVKRIADKTAKHVKSIGFALSSCTVPAKGTPTFALGETEMEYGVGIHGEPGIRRETVQGADALAKRMVDALCAELGVKAQNDTARVAVLINGFGATPLMELYLLNGAVARELHVRGVTVVRPFVGNYMTSLDMAGASISVLKLDDELETLLNEPSETLGMTITGAQESMTYCAQTSNADAVSGQAEVLDTKQYVCDTVGGTQLTLKNVAFILEVMTKSIIENEVPFCELDSHAGDGDFGMSVAKGFRQLKERWNHILRTSDDIGTLLNECAMIIMEHCGGASGPIWGSAFRAAGRCVMGKKMLSIPEFAEMMQQAVKGIQNTGERSFGRGAVVGDKTLIDALIPCADAWTVYAQQGGADFREGFQLGAEAAVIGAERTKDIVARMGRAGTVGERSLGFPDAGAYALGVIFTEICHHLK